MHQVGIHCPPTHTNIISHRANSIHPSRRPIHLLTRVLPSPTFHKTTGHHINFLLFTYRKEASQSHVQKISTKAVYLPASLKLLFKIPILITTSSGKILRSIFLRFSLDPFFVWIFGRQRQGQGQGQGYFICGSVQFVSFSCKSVADLKI